MNLVHRTGLVLALLISLPAFAQKNKSAARAVAASPAEIRVPMEAGRWEFPPEKARFLEHKAVPALQLLTSSDRVVLKDLNFSNGTIEFDMEPEDPNFAGIYFRRQNDQESEYFYLRVDGGVDPGIRWAIQYAPILKGVNLWDMLEYYQGPGSFRRNQWNHVKLVISGEQMRVYINDLNRPALEVPKLEGNTKEGGLAFQGKAVIANLVVKPQAVEGLAPTAGIDPTAHDPRYLRKWSVTQPVSMPYGQELTGKDLPTAETAWEPVEAERRGLVNLTRRFGKTEGRRLIWLRTRITAKTDEKRRLDFGFSDEVWVFVNRQPVYFDKNLYGQPIMKKPGGRCSVENSSFEVPLKAGENEMLIALTNDFFGWGLIARMENAEGITIER
ncbi:hypothetical protein [Larkinella soli]|uniref:hypothetical protein n=1 Tax=Larkinella soli TaxID=1770527 RepID=UPI000FFB4119|nr:hypothetical protein [Larkinella soli]